MVDAITMIEVKTSLCPKGLLGEGVQTRSANEIIPVLSCLNENMIHAEST